MLAEKSNPAAAFPAHKITAFATSRDHIPSGTWLIDSGATDHIAVSKEAFSNYKAHRDRIQVANNQYTDVLGIGSIILPVSILGQKRSSIKLLHVLHAPTCPYNFISYDRIVKKFTFIGDHTGAITKDHGNIISFSNTSKAPPDSRTA